MNTAERQGMCAHWGSRPSDLPHAASLSYPRPQQCHWAENICPSIQHRWFLGKCQQSRPSVATDRSGPVDALRVACLSSCECTPGSDEATPQRSKDIYLECQPHKASNTWLMNLSELCSVLSESQCMNISGGISSAMQRRSQRKSG